MQFCLFLFQQSWGQQFGCLNKVERLIFMLIVFRIKELHNKNNSYMFQTCQKHLGMCLSLIFHSVALETLLWIVNTNKTLNWATCNHVRHIRISIWRPRHTIQLQLGHTHINNTHYTCDGTLCCDAVPSPVPLPQQLNAWTYSKPKLGFNPQNIVLSCEDWFKCHHNNGTDTRKWKYAPSIGEHTSTLWCYFAVCVLK